MWHNLNCRGKYAGEVRMEITYYDSRPKQTSREQTPMPSNIDGAGRDGREATAGPRVQKERVKRRPLPSDPITGIAPTLPEAQQYRVGPRDPRPKVAPAPPPKPVPVEPQQQERSTQPQQQQRGYPTEQPEYQQQQQYAQAQELTQRDPPQSYSQQEQMRSYGQPTQQYLPEQSPLQRVEYQNQDYGRPTSRGDQGRYEQPPPQAQYDNKPSLNMARSNQSLDNSESQYGQVPGLQESQVARDLYNQRYNQHPQAAYAESVSSSQQSEDYYPRGRTEQRTEYASPYVIPQVDSFSSPDGPPPPPPVHRHLASANGSTPTTPGYGYTAPNPVKDQFERLRDGHRNSMPAYSNTAPAPYQNAYTTTRQHAPQPQQPQPLQHVYTEPIVPHNDQPRHKLLDGYDNHYSSMQPTVEDAPPTPAPFQQESRQSMPPSQHQHVSDRQYDDVPSPAPLSFHRPGSSSSMMPQQVPAAATNNYNNAGYASDPYMNQSHSAPPPAEYAQPAYTRDNCSRSPAPPPTEYQQQAYNRENRPRSPATPRNDYAQSSYNRSRSPAPPQPYQESQRGVSPAPPQRFQDEELERPGSGYMPPLPPTLVAGLDPAIAQEISDRIYSESRFQRQPRQRQEQSPQRGGDWAREAAQRHAEEMQYDRPTSSQGRPKSSQGAAAQTAAIGAGRFYAQPSYVPPERQERQGRSIPATFTPSIRTRSRSPMPPPSHQHTISRKSVSPAPPPSRGSDGEGRQRRLSAVPFGPDDYSALNPNIPAAAAAVATQDPDAKIITQDGREIDPSDHLPSSSWAALPPNLKKSFDNASARETRLRGVTQPAGRTMQRRDRPQSEIYNRPDTVTPPAAGRTRLVKKANRMTAQPQSSPLASTSGNPERYARNRDDYRSEGDAGRFTMPNRAQTFDTGYADREREVYGSSYRPQPGPPAPAKIPLPHMNSAPAAPPKDPNESAWALLEEMKSIDLGSGTGRRRRGGHTIV